MAATKRRFSSLQQGDLFAAAPGIPEGFVYREEVITPDDERKLLGQLVELPFAPFEFHGYLGKRRVVSFGWRYDHAGRTLRDSIAIPTALLPLREQAAAFAEVPPESLQQILVNEYAPGAGIGWHRDRPIFEDVIAISLGATCTLRLRRRRGAAWERALRTLHPRSAYLLRGSSRWEWEHSITPLDHLRYSVTFRNFASGEIPGAASAPPPTATVRMSP